MCVFGSSYFLRTFTMTGVGCSLLPLLLLASDSHSYAQPFLSVSFYYIQLCYYLVGSFTRCYVGALHGYYRLVSFKRCQNIDNISMCHYFDIVLSFLSCHVLTVILMLCLSSYLFYYPWESVFGLMFTESILHYG